MQCHTNSPEETPFKVCPVCGKEWTDRANFLSDPQLLLSGYQVNFEALREGFFLFTHLKCKGTMAMEVGIFSGLYHGEIFQERMTGSECCPGFCLKDSLFQVCPAKCECAFVREVMQILLNWTKDFSGTGDSCSGILTEDRGV